MKLDAEKQIEQAGYVWSMNTNLGDGKMMQITGNFAKGADAKEMTAELDKCAKVMQIQRLKLLEIPASEAALRTQAEAGDNFQNQLDKLIEENTGKKENTQIKQLMGNLRENISRTADNLESGKQHLARLIDQLAALEGNEPIAGLLE